MSKLNVSRALFSLGDNLGALANNSAQRDHERLMAMREENLTKLRYELEGKQMAGQQEFTAKENDKDRATQQDQYLSTQLTNVEQANLDRTARAKEGAADRDLTRERYGREDLAASDTAYLRQLDAIDDRMANLSNMRTKAGLEGQMSDPAALQQVDAELQQLQAQKRDLAQERDLNLARRGDVRYKKLTPEEAKARLAAQGAPADSSGVGGTPTVAAQGPSIKSPRPAPTKVPQMPPMEPAMQERLQRQGRQVVPTEISQALQQTAPPELARSPDNAREQDQQEAARTQQRRGALEKLDRLTLEKLKRAPDTDRETRAMIREILDNISRDTTRRAMQR